MTSTTTTSHALDDSTLLAQIGTGRVVALAELHQRYGAPMWSLARLLLQPKPAEDVVVAVLAELWRSPSALGGETTRDARLPLVCRLLDAVLRRSLAVRPGAIRDRQVALICGYAPRERAALILISGGASRAQAGAAVGKSAREVTVMLRDTLGQQRF